MKKLITLGVLLLFSASLITGCTPKEIRTAKIELGKRAKPKRNPDIARVKDNLTRAFDLYPNNPEVYYLWGWVNAIEENYVEMDKGFTKSLELGDNYKADIDTIRMENSDKLANKADAARQNEDFESALENFKLAGLCWPNRYNVFLFGAESAYNLKKFEEAYQLSKQAYELAPDSLMVIQYYGDMSMINDKLDEAQTAYEKVLEKDPTNIKVLMQMSEFYALSNDTTKALECLDKVLQIDENNSQAWFNRGLFFFQMKDYCKAAENFGRVTALTPENIDVRVNYLVSLVQCGKYDEARTELEEFTIKNPENCDGWDLLSQTYLRLKMKKEARKAFKKFEDCNGK